MVQFAVRTREVVTVDVLFILGMPRSGTKLLRDILNRHPEVAIFPVESHFLPYFQSRFPQYGDISQRSNFDRFYADVQQTNFMRALSERDIHFPADEWFASLQGNSFGSAIESLFAIYAGRSGSRIAGDKTPAYITEAELLLDLFPNAKFVHIVRDPRDYVLSLRNAWNQNAIRAAQRWKDSIRNLHAVMKARHIEYAEIRYEDLVSDPRAAVTRVCDYLGIDFDETMLNFDRPTENIGDAKGALGVVSKNFGKWRHSLRAPEVHAIEAIAGVMIDSLGYELYGQAGDRDASRVYLRIARLQDTWNRFRFIYRDEKSLTGAFRRIGRTARFRVRNG